MSLSRHPANPTLTLHGSRSALAGSVALVTGGSSGIGQALAWALAARGSDVLAVGRSRDGLDRTIRGAPADSAVITGIQLDLSEPGAPERIRLELERTAGLDVLVHSAATMCLNRLCEAQAQLFDSQYALNLRAPYFLTQSLLPLLKAARGQVVFINSSIGLIANRPEVGQYAATKHGLKAVADSLRAEVNQDGVRVLSVYPGRTATPMQEGLHRLEGKEYHPGLLLQPSDVAAIVVSSLELPATAEVTDISIRPMIKP